MLVHYDINQLPVFKNAVITIGSFDGVHLGHLQIINQLKETAAAINGETVIITFHPHPRKVVSSKEFFILNTLEEKTELLAAAGINHLVIIPFTEIFSEQTAEQYIKNFLVETFHPHIIIIGYDHKFGKNRKGDYKLMEDYGKQFGFEVKEIPQHIINDVTISSTKIREALLSGSLETANECLGYNYFFEGEIVEGNKLGRTIGYPTANISIDNANKLIPANGVYAVKCEIRSTKYEVRNQDTEKQSAKYEVQKKEQVENVHSNFVLRTSNFVAGMMNIGLRPTVDGTKRTIEVNLFDFDENIYGKILRIHLYKYLRPEIKFIGLDALKEQLAKDKEAVNSILN